MVVLDYDRDNKLDLFLLGAVVENGQVRDLLLHNDGNGHFTDVTAKAGLGGARPSLGCCVADFDNDGYPDLFITGIGEQHLFRNNRKGGFEEVTAETGKDRGNNAGLDKLNTVCLTAGFVDLDQDGDLDLVVCQYAATPQEALATLKKTVTSAGPGLAIYLNVGEAPAENPGVDPPPLKPRFRRADDLSSFSGEGGCTTGLVLSDLELDGDLDILALADRLAPTAILNDRLLRFHKRILPEALVNAGLWNGGLVIDANQDGRSDLFLIGPGQRPVLLLGKSAPGEDDIGKWFQVGATNSPPLIQASAVDIDYDGWPDVVGLSEQRKPVLLHNDGQRLVHEANAFGRDDDWPNDLISLSMLNVKGGRYQDLLVWSESGGLQAYANQGNGNNALMLVLSGHRRVESTGSIVRCNADGVGTRVTAQVDNLRTGLENTTLAAGLGQSRRPLLLGLGKATEADAVRLRWPDYCLQGELDVPTGQAFRIEER